MCIYTGQQISLQIKKAPVQILPLVINIVGGIMQLIFTYTQSRNTDQTYRAGSKNKITYTKL